VEHFYIHDPFAFYQGRLGSSTSFSMSLAKIEYVRNTYHLSGCVPLLQTYNIEFMIPADLLQYMYTIKEVILISDLKLLFKAHV
jgi:hypothetical protein